MDLVDHAICVERIEMYQLPPADPNLNLPFALLDGEAVLPAHHGNSRDGLIVVTNYRLFLQNGRVHYHVPLGLIELVETKELFYLHVSCKDARTYRCTFETSEACSSWNEKISKAAEPPKQLSQLFAFYHFAHFRPSDTYGPKAERFDLGSFADEMRRMKFEDDLWRLSNVNANYEVCPTYPPFLTVPRDIDDENLKMVAKFRSSKRIPAVVWRHSRNGAVIARCSQPEVGWFGWRGEEDEKLIKSIAKIYEDTKVKENTKKVLILDARSYAIAVANRARGGGCECPQYYANADIQFMNLANIHSIRKSFQSLRALCSSSDPIADTFDRWFSQLEGTKWLHHMSGLMKAAFTLMTAVHTEGRPVVVHCSDGWDRTPQIVALSELLMDPYYRTVDGFRVLIEREWLAFGHKFADRCGHSTGSEDLNERCPVFLQWLDCIHQILRRNPCDFEFSEAYLIKLGQHTYSNLFGTFLCNTLKERLKIVNKTTFSIWEFLGSPRFRNHLYERPANLNVPHAIWPMINVRDLRVWREMYFGTMEANFHADEASQESCPGPPDLVYRVPKTRSYHDLSAAGPSGEGPARRSSDPSINSDKTAAAFDANHSKSEAELVDEEAELEELNGEADDQIGRIGLQVPRRQPRRESERLSTCSSGSSVCCGSPPVMIERPTSTEVQEFFGSAAAPADDRTKECATVPDVSAGPDRGVADGCSIEGSTDATVPEEAGSSSPKEVNGFENIHTPSDPIDIPSGSRSWSQPHERLSSSNSPRISSSNGWDNTLAGAPRANPHAHDQLGDDGLIPLRSYIQERISKMIEERKRNEEKLQKEIHTYRQVLLNQTCLKCCGEKLEDNDLEEGSVVESVGSAGEGNASTVESLPSDRSWESLDYTFYNELQGTKWVPDHAVSRCTNCNIKFWIGKRKHHCRKCGNIFCSDCSENSTPLPSEHLFDPVRVCTGCFNRLQRGCGEMMTCNSQCNDRCKMAQSQPNGGRQITASSN